MSITLMQSAMLFHATQTDQSKFYSTVRDVRQTYYGTTASGPGPAASESMAEGYNDRKIKAWILAFHEEIVGKGLRVLK